MNPALRVLVVDDERPARAKVLRILRSDPRFEVVGEARDGIEALSLIEALSPAVVVLDIQMPGLSGFEVLAALGAQVDFVVVFSTAYDCYALQAFEVHAVDYLLKPYEPERLIRAMDKAYAQLLNGRSAELLATHVSLVQAAQRISERLTVRTVEGSWLVLRSADVLRIAAANKHTRIVLREGEQRVRMPLSELAASLSARLVRVHRSEYVNVEAVVRVDPWTHGDAILVLDDDSTLVLTRTYRSEFLARFADATGASKPPLDPHACAMVPKGGGSHT